MCGIAGICGGVSEPRALTESMLSALQRRGPDGQGLHSWPEATFGHRRLAIYDLSSAGDQPMLAPDRSVGVVFNGAIYNFLELRDELTKRGHAFTSRTDTEVLIHGYRAWGLDGLIARLRGMFAFALWDEAKQTLFLVRDRLGVKPLFYVQNGSSLAFASTAGALRAANLCGDISAQAIAEFLQFGF